MTDYNILILSAGRRVELINCFKDAAKKIGIQSKIIAEDCSKYSPAIYFADKKVILPKIKDEDYIEKLIDLCKKEYIKLIIPTIDTNLLILAENKSFIEKETEAKVLISDYDTVSIFRDKIKSQSFFEKNNFLVPKFYSEINIEQNEIDFPLFIKPLDGSSSINAFKVDTHDELNFLIRKIKNPIIQQFVSGDEYTVDCFLNFDGTPITIVPRLRIETRGGEILKGKIIKDKLIIDEVKKLLNTINFIGAITIQLMKNNNKIFFIEINPRFGGGAPMSIKSGANSCLNLYKLLMNEKLEYNEKYENDKVFLRFDSSISI